MIIILICTNIIYTCCGTLCKQIFIKGNNNKNNDLALSPNLKLLLKLKES